MAKIVDVTDVPELPGAGLLHFDDGRPPLMALPEVADEHRERLGISAMREGVAGPGAPDPDAWKTQWGGTLNPHTVPVPAAQSPAAPAPAPSQPQPDASGVPPALARPPESTAPAEPEDPAIAASDARLAQALITGRQAGGPPVPARPAGFSPDTKKVVTEAGPAYDVHAAGDRLDAGAAVLDAQLAKAATDKNIAEAAAAHAQAQNLHAQQQVAKQQADIVRKQQEFQQQNAAYQKDLDEYTQSAAPDPARYFQNKGAISSFLSIIGQGLGAFGAGLTHTQNFAFEAAQNEMKADMAAQQAAFDAGRADRKNALARFVDYYHGDIDMAKSALAQAMNKVAETETMQFAAQSQSQSVTANAKVLAAQFQQQQLLEEQKRADLAAGKVTTTTEDKFHQATGGSPGGKPLTLEQELAIRKFKKPKDAKEQGALGLTPQAEARQKAAYSTKLENAARFADALSHRATLMGLHFDPDSGDLLNGSGKIATEKDLDVPTGAGVIGKHIASDVLTPKAMELRRAEVNSVRLHAAAIYNHSISAEEGEKEVDDTIGNTDSAKLANLKYLAEEYRKQKLAIDTGAASIDPRMVNSRKEAERAVNYSHATKRPLPEPTPMRGYPSAADERETDGAEQ